MGKNIDSLLFGRDKFLVKQNLNVDYEQDEKTELLSKTGTVDFVSFRNSAICKPYALLISKTDSEYTFSVRLNIIYRVNDEYRNAVDFVKSATLEFYTDGVYTDDGTENEVEEAIMTRQNNSDFYSVEIIVKKSQRLYFDVKTCFGTLNEVLDLSISQEYYVGVRSDFYPQKKLVSYTELLGVNLPIIESSPFLYLKELDVDINELSIGGSIDDNGIYNVSLPKLVGDYIIVLCKGINISPLAVSDSDGNKIEMQLLGFTTITDDSIRMHYRVYASGSKKTANSLKIKIGLS